MKKLGSFTACMLLLLAAGCQDATTAKSDIPVALVGNWKAREPYTAYMGGSWHTMSNITVSFYPNGCQINYNDSQLGASSQTSTTNPSNPSTRDTVAATLTSGTGFSPSAGNVTWYRFTGVTPKILSIQTSTDNRATWSDLSLYDRY